MTLRDAPLAIDLFCGLGGWTDGLLAEGWRVIGFDIERHVYGAHRYPAQLVLQDVLTLHGSQFRGAQLIVASPPCQAYSYRAMPWKRAKALPPPDNALFDACFRIQREACAAAGRYIPMIVENVRGAQKWVGRARWHFGSFYLWGDVPALMPQTAHFESHGLNWSDPTERGQDFTRIAGGHATKNDGSGWRPNGTLVSCNRMVPDGRGIKQHGSGAAWWDKALDERRIAATAVKNGGDWFGAGADCSMQRHAGSKSPSRKFASAMIAKIPLPLARYVGRVFMPREGARNCELVA